jgi:tetratricopeptide (TPR) repeat protein
MQVDTTLTSNDLIEVYKTIMQQENSNHTTIMYVLLGITVVLLGATWWWNKIGANKYITTTVTEELKKEMIVFNSKISKNLDEKFKEFDTRINEKFDEKFEDYNTTTKNLYWEIYRTFGLSLYQSKSYEHAIFYFSKVLELSIEMNRQSSIRTFTESLLLCLKNNETKKVYCLEFVRGIVEKIPNTLDIEKEKIQNSLKQSKDAKDPK